MLQKERAMKKVVCLLLFVFLFSPILSSQNHKKVKTRTFDHLKRRYPRKHGLQPHGEKLEQDDFGYTPTKIAHRN